jgi:hypothetical protein
MPWKSAADVLYAPPIAAFTVMPLLPRWRFMTDQSKAMVRRTAVSAAVVLFVLLVFRSLLPWVVLVVLAWWLWRAVRA